MAITPLYQKQLKFDFEKILMKTPAPLNVSFIDWYSSGMFMIQPRVPILEALRWTPSTPFLYKPFSEIPKTFLSVLSTA